MCPICWATALATFGVLVVVSIVVVAGSDKWALLLAAFLGIVSIAHRLGIVTSPWWFIAALMIAASARVGHLIVLKRDGLLIRSAWNLACKVAARRCPTNSSSAVVSEI